MKIQTVNNYINRNYQKRDVENVVSHQFNFVTNTIDLNSLGAFRTYAITSPSFRGVSSPMDVTDKYNKKVEGANHLDLPNVRVYEYPDTNLKLFVNFIESKTDIEDDFMFAPQVLMKISDNKNNSMYDAALRSIISKKLVEVSNDVVLVQSKESFLYFEPISKNKFNNLEKFNKQIFNLQITEEDIEFLKKNNKEQFKSLDKKVLQSYYDTKKNNLSAEAYVVISQSDYQKNKKDIEINLSKGLNVKFDKNITSETRQNIIEELSAILLSSYRKFNENYRIETNEDIFSDQKFSITKNKNSVGVELNDIKKEISTLDISDKLNSIKESYKEELKERFSDEELPITKIIELSKYGEDVFKAYEIIDSITEDEIKESIRML